MLKSYFRASACNIWGSIHDVTMLTLLHILALAAFPLTHWNHFYFFQPLEAVPHVLCAYGPLACSPYCLHTVALSVLTVSPCIYVLLNNNILLIQTKD